MRIYVDRYGSGWGGYHGFYIIDCDAKKLYVLKESLNEETFKYVMYMSRESLEKKSEYVVDFDFAFNKILEVSDSINFEYTYGCFDQQQDRVYVVPDFDDDFCIWDTTGTKMARPSDEVLRDEVVRFINKISSSVRL